jgi:putative PIN family toxin of toxin-antitoxin system
MQKIRAVLDTNLWISFLISRKYDAIDLLFESDQLTLLFSERLIGEFTEVALRPKFRRYFQSEDIEEILLSFDVFGEKIEVSTIVNLCRDEKDNFLISLAIDGQADYLITGDADLLILEQVENVRIVTYRDFLELL